MITCPWCERKIDIPEIVEIDPDAMPPENPYDPPGDTHIMIGKALGYVDAQQDMIKADWIRVKI